MSYCSSCSRNSVSRSILSSESHQARVSRNGMTYALPEHPSYNQPRYTPTKLSRTPSARTATGSVSPYTGSGQTYVNRRATSARLTPAVSTKEDLNEVKRNEQIKGIRSILRPIIYMLWAIYLGYRGLRSILYCPVFIRLKIERGKKLVIAICLRRTRKPYPKMKKLFVGPSKKWTHGSENYRPHFHQFKILWDHITLSKIGSDPIWTCLNRFDPVKKMLYYFTGQIVRPN